MSFLSYSNLDKLTKSLNEHTLIKCASQTTSGKDLFLSHSSIDKNRIASIIEFFDKFYISTYVDIGDNRLPESPSIETAQLLRAEISQIPRFVVLISENSYSSRWIPWELGLADGIKGTGNIALLPISKTGQEEIWAKQEYLGLYPTIRYDDKSKIWVVSDPRDNKYWELNVWLDVKKKMA